MSYSALLLSCVICVHAFSVWESSRESCCFNMFQRCPLDNLVLQVKLLDLGEPKAILGLALSPPNLDDLERTVLVLKEVN